MLAVWGGYGTVHNTGSQPATEEGGLQVAIVQGGLHSGRGDLVAANDEAWAIYSSLTTQDSWTTLRAGSAPTTDLLVWPETVLRVYLRQDDTYSQRVVDLVRRLGRPLFLGSSDLPADGPGEWNSGYLIENHGGGDWNNDAQDSAPMQIYHKVRLLPFGEYVPGATLLPMLSRWHTTGRFVAGESSHPLAVMVWRGEEQRTEHNALHDRLRAGSARVTTFAPSICFEAVWPGAFNQLVREGAEFLVNLTDDGWFGDSAEPYQHLQAATLRAVETRRWLVRASNSGVSAFVDPTGRVVASLPLNAVGVLHHAVGTWRAVSLYMRWGNWLIPFCLVCCVAPTAARRQGEQAARAASSPRL
jgi:apolipoprotein N-acyltransferase